ncbi:MAG TPA: phage major capsid protein [Phycisphaerales bacterium]|nr:phage major capsid protein [Phycisphaerales bacterium]
MQVLAKYRRDLHDLIDIEKERNLTAEELRETHRLEDAIQRREEHIKQQRSLSVDGDVNGFFDIRAANIDNLSDGGFENAGEFLQALYRKARGEGFDDRLQALQVSSSLDEGGTGGFAVPTQFVARAFDNGPVGDDGVVLLNLCDKVPMKTDKMSAPGFVNNNHSTAPYGIAWGAISEGNDFSESSVEVRGIQLEARKHGALFYVTNEWLSDASPFMRSRLEQIFYRSLRWYVEGQLLNGTGAGTAKGVLVSSATLEISKESSQVADTLMTENILKMWARLLPGSHNRAIWMANQTCFPQLGTLSLTIKNVAGTENVGGSVVPLLQVNNSGMASAPATSILGRPLHFSEHLPALGNPGDIILLDPLLYVLGDRQSIVVDVSPHIKFTSDKTTYRAKARFDGQPAMSSTFTPKNGDTCGWAVKLAERA